MMKNFLYITMILLVSDVVAQELSISDLEKTELGQLVVAPNFLTEKGFQLESLQTSDRYNYHSCYSNLTSGNRIIVKKSRSSDGTINYEVQYYLTVKNYYSNLVDQLNESKYHFYPKIDIYRLKTSSYSDKSFIIRENIEINGTNYFLITYLNYLGKELSTPIIIKE